MVAVAVAAPQIVGAGVVVVIAGPAATTPVESNEFDVPSAKIGKAEVYVRATTVPRAGPFVTGIEIGVGVRAGTGVGPSTPSVGALNTSVPGTVVGHGLLAKISESVALTFAAGQVTAIGDVNVTAIALTTVPVTVVSPAVPPWNGVPAAVSFTSTRPPTGAKFVPLTVTSAGVSAETGLPVMEAATGALTVTKPAGESAHEPLGQITRATAVAEAAPQTRAAGNVVLSVVWVNSVPGTSKALAVPSAKIGLAEVQRTVTWPNGPATGAKFVPVIVSAVGVKAGTALVEIDRTVGAVNVTVPAASGDGQVLPLNRMPTFAVKFDGHAAAIGVRPVIVVEAVMLPVTVVSALLPFWNGFPAVAVKTTVA